MVFFLRPLLSPAKSTNSGEKELESPRTRTFCPKNCLSTTDRMRSTGDVTLRSIGRKSWERMVARANDATHRDMNDLYFSESKSLTNKEFEIRRKFESIKKRIQQ